MLDPEPHPGTPRPGQLGKVAVVGSVMNSGQWVLNKACTAGATLLLAHWLTPEEFGVAGQATALVQFLTLAVPFALGDVVITHASRSAAVIAVATRLSRQLALLNVVVLLAAIPVCAAVFSDMPSAWLAALLCICGVRPLMEALQVPALSRLRLQLRYRAIASIDGTSQLIGTVCSIVLAAVGFGAASLALPVALAGTSRTWIYRRLSPPDSKVSESDPRVARELMLDFLPVSVAQYLHKVASSLELLVLGLASSAFETGLFAFSVLLAAQANTVIAHQLGVVLQPVFGRMADDSDRQARSLLRTLHVLGLVCVPISLAQAVFAEPAFRLLFADRYQPAVPVFGVLSLVQVLLFALGPTMACLRAQRQFKPFLMWQVSELALGTVVCWIAACSWGAIGAAAGHGVVWCLWMPVLVWLALRGRTRHAMLQACNVFLIPIAMFVPLFAVAMQGVNWISGWSRHGDAWSLLLLLPASLVVALGLGVLVNRDMRRFARWIAQRLRRTSSEAVP